LGERVAALVWPNVPVSAKLPVVPPLLNGLLPGAKSSALIRVKVQPRRNVVQAVQFQSAALTSRLTREVRPAGALPMAAQLRCAGSPPSPLRQVLAAMWVRPVHLCNVQ
jgi:hypothetical protein